MDDLIAFLKARLDEDERAAACYPSGRRIHPEDLKWAYQPDGDPDVPGGDVIARGHRIVMDQPEVIAAHIARWDPDRVRREVEAKRRILTEHRQAMPDWCETCDIPGDYKGRPEACTTVRLLALPYVDHKEFREEWRP